jgi:hypothetical protein
MRIKCSEAVRCRGPCRWSCVPRTWVSAPSCSLRMIRGAFGITLRLSRTVCVCAPACSPLAVWLTAQQPVLCVCLAASLQAAESVCVLLPYFNTSSPDMCLHAGHIGFQKQAHSAGMLSPACLLVHKLPSPFSLANTGCFLMLARKPRQQR